ncbi:MAG: FixH family protein [Pseudomonadota bacterium]
MTPTDSRPPLTGRRVLLIAVLCFGTVIAANIAMVIAATGSFPGVVVKNAYVEGQGWNQRARDQQALGWQFRPHYDGATLSLGLTGEGSEAATLAVTIGRPTTDVQDRVRTLAPGTQTLPADLTPGVWRIELRSTGQPAYRSVAQIRVTAK